MKNLDIYIKVNLCRIILPSFLILESVFRVSKPILTFCFEIFLRYIRKCLLDNFCNSFHQCFIFCTFILFLCNKMLLDVFTIS